MRRGAAAVVLLALAVPADGEARTLHVRGAEDLAAAQRASRPGDRIVVHATTAAYEGRVRLKPRQRLIGRGRPQLTNPDGDVVRLASHTVVRGLRIVGAGRGGIYGRNVGDVVVRGNDVSGHNATCAAGFLIPPFNVPTTVPGVGVPISDGLQNGWAGIMVDATRGTRRVVIRGNHVHDADCGDGIDVRASGTSRVRATIARNRVTDLRQGEGLQSVLAIGLQSAEQARLSARLHRNRQAGLGNDGDLPGPEGADSEGVFINPVGPSTLHATVTRNVYTHTPGRGGFSANGLEFVSMDDGAHARVVVRDSRFSGTPGDVLEQLALGTGSDLRLTLERVSATGSTGFAGTGEGNTVLIPGNNGDCLVAASGGAGNRVRTTIRDSVLSDCANNGLTFGSSVANGDGPTTDLRLDLSGSRLTGNRGNNLRVGNVTGLDRLRVKVQDTDLADARGTGSLTPANASFEDLGTTADAVIDLGGGALGSTGGNCLDGGMLAAALVRYDVTAQGNWWGGPVRATAAGGTLAADPVLDTAPERCGGSAAVMRPDDDPFYAAPAGLAAARRGAILRSREIDVTAVGIPLPLEGHQILYRTTDTHGAPEAAVATVIVPLSAPPESGRPLLSYQPAEDTLTRDCASSYEIRQGQMPELPEALAPLLTDGAAVVIPDYEGPESQWTAGVQAGHAVLDAVRATERFEPAGLPGRRTRVGLWGYSGGAQATAWAAELQPRYAPELDVVGAAHGAAPYVLRETVAYLDGGPFAGILLAAVVGMGRAYPEMRLDDVLNDAGKAMRDDVGDKCIESFAGAYPGARLDDFTKVPNAKDLPHVSRVIDANDLGHRTPSAPTYIYQSATDELEPVAGADAIVANYCRRGVAVQYERAAAGEHIEFQVRGAPAAAAYLADRFAGKPAPSTCPPGSTPPAPRCAIVVRLRHRPGERITRAVARVGGRRVAARRGNDLRRLRIRGLRPGRRTIRLRLRTTSGTRRLVVRRRVRC